MEFLKKIVWFPAKSQIKRGRNPQVISEMSTVSPGRKKKKDIPGIYQDSL